MEVEKKSPQQPPTDQPVLHVPATRRRYSCGQAVCGRHTKVGRGTQEEPVRVPVYTFRHIAGGRGGAAGAPCVKSRFLSFLRTAGSAASVLPACLPALRTEAGAGGEKVIRLTCDLMGDGSVREASDREGKIHQAGLASSVRGLRASLSLAAAALRGKILRVVDLHDNAAPERINCGGMGGNPPRL